MTTHLNLIEESEYWEKFATPFLSYASTSLVERKRVAMEILIKKPEEILLIDKAGFGIDSIFAGLGERHIEFFAKHAPLAYKKEMMNIFKDSGMMNGVFEIANAMDEDENNGSTRNQTRVKKVIQYIQDNRPVFQF